MSPLLRRGCGAGRLALLLLALGHSISPTVCQNPACTGLEDAAASGQCDVTKGLSCVEPFSANAGACLATCCEEVGSPIIVPTGSADCTTLGINECYSPCVADYATDQCRAFETCADAYGDQGLCESVPGCAFDQSMYRCVIAGPVDCTVLGINECYSPCVADYATDQCRAFETCADASMDQEFCETVPGCAFDQSMYQCVATGPVTTTAPTTPPITAVPITGRPTTAIPSTAAPTPAPTTQAPTTAEPTPNPTTQPPTTVDPTPTPTTAGPTLTPTLGPTARQLATCGENCASDSCSAVDESCTDIRDEPHCVYHMPNGAGAICFLTVEGECNGLGALFRVGCSGTFSTEPLAGCDALNNVYPLARCEQIAFNDGCANTFWSNLCAWTCAECASHSPTISPSPSPTASPTPLSELEDQCATEACAMFCTGSCGWDNETGICRTGELTSPTEHRLQLGDCPTLAPTAAGTRTTTTSTGTTVTSTTISSTLTPSDLCERSRQSERCNHILDDPSDRYSHTQCLESDCINASGCVFATDGVTYMQRCELQACIHFDFDPVSCASIGCEYNADLVVCQEDIGQPAPCRAFNWQPDECASNVTDGRCTMLEQGACVEVARDDLQCEFYGESNCPDARCLYVVDTSDESFVSGRCTPVTTTTTTATTATTTTTLTENILTCSAIPSGGRQRCNLAALECTYDLVLSACRDKICSDLSSFQCNNASASVREDSCVWSSEFGACHSAGQPIACRGFGTNETRCDPARCTFLGSCWDVDAEIPCWSYPEATCPSPRCSVAWNYCELFVSTTPPGSTIPALSLVPTPAPTALDNTTAAPSTPPPTTAPVTPLPTAAPLTPPPTATPNLAPTAVRPTVSPSSVPTVAPTVSTTTSTTTLTSSTQTTTTSVHRMFPVPWTFQSDTSIVSLRDPLSVAFFRDRFSAAVAHVAGAARWQVEVVDVNPATGEVSGRLTAIWENLSLDEMNNRVAVEGLRVPPFQIFPATATTVAAETNAPPTVARTPTSNSNKPDDAVAGSSDSSTSSSAGVSRNTLFIVATVVVVLSMGVTLCHMRQQRADQLQAKATMMNPAYDFSRGGSRVLPGSSLASGPAMDMAGSPMPTSPTPSFRGNYDMPVDKAFTFNPSKVHTVKLGAYGFDGRLEDAEA